MANSSRRSDVPASCNRCRNVRRYLWICLYSVLASLYGPAVLGLKGQAPLQDVGIPAYTTALPVENGFINAANGSLHLSIPLGTWTERGGQKFTASLMGVTGANQTFSWSLITSGDPGSVGYGYSDNNTYCDKDDQPYLYTYSPFTWTAPDHTTHSFDISTDEPVPNQCRPNVGGGTSGDDFATDASGYHMFVTDATNITVYAPDGTQVYPSVQDSNGNQYAMSGGTIYYTPIYSQYSSYTDSLGRTLLTVSQSGGNTYINVLNSQGGTSTYTVLTASGYIPWNGYCVSNPGMKEVDLPDGTKYSFTYDIGPDCSSVHYGDLLSMTLPTGAEISYTFTPLYPSYPEYNRVISTRTTPDSSTPWTYTNLSESSPYFTVTKPNGDQELYTFEGASPPWPTEAQFYSGSTSSGTLVATITQTWELWSDWVCGYAANCYGVKTAVTTTLPVPGGNVNRTTQFVWDLAGTPPYPLGDTPGNLTQRSEWKFYTGSLPSTADKVTNYTYLSGTAYTNAGIVNRPTSITVTNGSGTTVAQTLNCYDYASGCGTSPLSTTFANPGTITNQASGFGTSYTTRGDLTNVERLVSGSTYLTESESYDIAGQLQAETDWSNSNTTSYSYTDAYVDDNTSNSESFSGHPTSPATDGYPTTITAPLSDASMTYKYYYGTGQRSSATDANGQTWYWHFGDPLNRPTSTKTPNQFNSTCCGWTLLAYPTPSGSETQVDTGIGITTSALQTTCSGSGDCRHNEKQLDGLGRVIHQMLVNDPDGETTVDTTYDSNGRVDTVTNPHRSSTLPTDGTETYPVYDGLDRKIQITRADGSVSYTYYGAAVTSHGGTGSQLCSGYGIGYPVLHIDEASRMLQDWYDGFGRLIEVDEPDPLLGSLTSGAPAGTCYSYDLNDNLTGVTQGSQTRSYSYDSVSRLTQSTDPESGTSYYYYTSSGGSLCSGDLKAICRRTDARSITTTYSYDALNRLTGKTYSDSTPSVSYSYSSTSCLDLSTCYNKNRRTGMTDGSGSTSWAYDQVGNIWEEKRTLGSVTDHILYTYNLDSSIAAIRYPSGRLITYAPGDAQRPLAATDSSTSYATSAHYAPPGGLGSVTNAGSIYFTELYNDRLQPCWQYGTTGTALAWNSNTTICGTTGVSAGTILDLEYTFNLGSSDNGNVQSAANNRDTTRSQSYTYDYVNRIITAAASTYAISPSNCWGEQFAIDRWGNMSGIGAISGTSAYNGCTQESLSITVGSSTNQISESGYGYDSAGNMTSAPPTGTTYTYDAENRLTSAGGVTYTYDGDDKRVEKSSGTLYWYDSGLNPLVETDGSGNTQYEYVFFNSKRIARVDSSGNVDYYFADDLGSSRIVTNSSGTILDDCDFYPYGGERSCVSSSSGNHYLFTGKERDGESGLDYFIARHYASSLGRFVQPDDFKKGGIVDAFTGLSVEAPGPLPYADINDPQTLNKYAYVRNNPLRFVDPDGHDDCAPQAQDCADEEAQKQSADETQKQVALTISLVQGQHDLAGTPYVEAAAGFTVSIQSTANFEPGDLTVSATLNFNADKQVAKGTEVLLGAAAESPQAQVGGQEAPKTVNTVLVDVRPYNQSGSFGGKPQEPGYIRFTTKDSQGNIQTGTLDVDVISKRVPEGLPLPASAWTQRLIVPIPSP